MSGEAQNKYGVAAKPPSEGELLKNQEQVKIKPTEESGGSPEALKKLGAASNKRPDLSPDDGGHQRESVTAIKAATEKAQFVRKNYEPTKTQTNPTSSNIPKPKQSGPKHSL
jgi:hypothetical protein